MKAEDLKQWPLVYKAYKKNADELFKTKNTSGLTWKEYKKTKKFKEIDSAFTWEDTKEGYEFWRSLYNDDVETAKALWSELFYIDNKVVEVNISSYELPEEVWTEHGEFLYSLKCKWLPIIPSQLDTQEAETVAWLLSNIYRVRKVSYKTSNYNKVNYTVEGGDPFKIAETIYKYRCVGVQSVGNLTCTFETTSGETRQESFDYVY